MEVGLVGQQKTEVSLSKQDAAGLLHICVYVRLTRFFWFFFYLKRQKRSLESLILVAT